MDPDVRVSGCIENIPTTEKKIRVFAQAFARLLDERLALINKGREDFQYNSRDLVYIILPLH